MNLPNNVVNIDSVRAGRNQDYPTIRIIDRLADSGASPFLARASDEKYYWCKTLQNDHGYESVINEIVGSIIGEAINAPVRPWQILRIPEELHNHLIDGKKRIKAGLVFGSLNLHTSDLNRLSPKIPHVNRDGNYNRIPSLIALWTLCNAEDLQVLFDASVDMQVWSIDHGFWFGSHESPWGLGDPSQRVGRTFIPPLGNPIPNTHWDRAIEDLGRLDSNIRKLAESAIPKEWGIDEQDVNKLVDYALGRKSYAIERLEKLRDTRVRR